MPDLRQKGNMYNLEPKFRVEGFMLYSKQPHRTKV